MSLHVGPVRPGRSTAVDFRSGSTDPARRGGPVAGPEGRIRGQLRHASALLEGRLTELDLGERVLQEGLHAAGDRGRDDGPGRRPLEDE